METTPVAAEPVYASAEDLMSETLDKEGEDVTLPSGKTVRLRGLTRAEMFANGAGDPTIAELEVRNVATCLIQPLMSRKQIEAWQAHARAGGDFTVIAQRIRELSGHGEGAGKS